MRKFIHLTLLQIYSNVEAKEDKMGRACSPHGKKGFGGEVSRKLTIAKT
jgi:hypothetical protein